MQLLPKTSRSLTTPISHLAAEAGLYPLDVGYLRGMTLKTLVYADDVKIRWLMLLASFGWVFFIAAQPGMFDRPYYAKMSEFLPPYAWAGLFAFHAFGALWRIYDKVERERAALVINGVGVVVWVAAVTCQNYASPGHITASNILEMIACLFLLGTFSATGYASKSTTA